MYPNGIRAIHAVITPNCRIVQGGNDEAFDEAVRRIKVEYDACLAGRGDDGSDYHLLLIVETPRHKTEATP